MLQSCLLALMLAAAGLPARAVQDAQPAPKELIDYVRQANKAGLNDGDIRKNAKDAGWPESAVTAALTAVGRPLPAPAAAPEPGSKAPSDPLPSNAPTVPKPPATSGDTAALAKSPAPNRGHGVSDDYVIGAGDVLQINVWKEPDASVAATVVRPEGKISMPLLKEVTVVGLSPAQAEQTIARQLSAFINNPEVTVVVSAVNSKKVYVLGAVKKESPIPYTYRMTIMQALSEAGGLTDYAKRKKIYVLRNVNGRDFRIPFDYDAVVRGQRMETNIELLPGDTLVIPH